MMTKRPIDRISIQGFKSIKKLKGFELHNLNVLIGPNGAGKSNFVSFFLMLRELVEGRLQNWTRMQGSADRIVSFGVKDTEDLCCLIEAKNYAYQFVLTPTIDGGFSFANEEIYSDVAVYEGDWNSLGSGHMESKLTNRHGSKDINIAAESISSWHIFHFHDTSGTAGVKRLGALHDNEFLRSDASNLAAFLYRLEQDEPNTYQQIRKVIQLAIPFFDDFVLKPQKLPSEEQQIRLLWKQKDSDYPFWPSQLSDGSIRFICLATALLQPAPPSTIIIDEPELGLHPYAIALLASLLRSASKRMQVIVSTQSAPLVNEFSIADLIVVEREQGATTFKRHDEATFKGWLEEYSVGELWEKNILGGRPGR